MSILTDGNITDFFHEVVESAIKARKVEATDGATTYLVSLLSDYARPDARAEQAMDRPLAFQLSEALQTVAAGERFDRLRVLGDGVLYSCGFFGDHFEARGVDQSYLVGIGRTAYQSAGAILTSHVSPSERPSSMDVFGELASKFASFVEVISEVADTTVAKGAASSKGLLKLYERWQKTKSGTLAQALSSHGLVPMNVPKGKAS
jgi:hypothetical protein